MKTPSHSLNRRRFLDLSTRTVAASTLAASGTHLFGQAAGDRPSQAGDVQVINPRNRVPVGLIIDDSTCLVNLNRFAMPQFNTAWDGKNKTYHRNWRDWPVEIPDHFVRKFGEWCAEHGVKGKYSIVPFPACVGRVDLELPGWSRRELKNSIRLVQDLMMPNWDIHPEMVTHTRVIDLKTGHPYPDYSLDYMENWDWTTGRSVDELASYAAYGLQILKNVDLPCEGVTTPGGYGSRVLPEIAQSTMQSVRDVFGAEIPHYFRHLYTDDRSVAPRVEYARDLDSSNPQCVVSVIGCTGDWTGGWDNTEPAGTDRFITDDLQSGRMVDVITKGEPAMMVCHWTGIHWNGEEKGFKVFQEVVRRLHERFDNLLWMKTGELARYWAAKELTRIQRKGNTVELNAPYACPDFTVQLNTPAPFRPVLQVLDALEPFREVASSRELQANTWHRSGNRTHITFNLPKGRSTLRLS